MGQLGLGRGLNSQRDRNVPKRLQYWRRVQFGPAAGLWEAQIRGAPGPAGPGERVKFSKRPKCTKAYVILAMGAVWACCWSLGSANSRGSWASWAWGEG